LVIGHRSSVIGHRSSVIGHRSSVVRLNPQVSLGCASFGLRQPEPGLGLAGLADGLRL
jgi:hypothetical protein